MPGAFRRVHRREIARCGSGAKYIARIIGFHQRTGCFKQWLWHLLVADAKRNF